MKQQGKIDSRVVLTADSFKGAASLGYPMSINAAGDAKIDVALQLGLASEAALLEDFEFSHLSISFATDATGVTLVFKYTDPDGAIGTVTVTHYIDASAGLQVYPIGFKFLKGSTVCYVSVLGGSTASRTLCLHGVR